MYYTCYTYNIICIYYTYYMHILHIHIIYIYFMYISWRRKWQPTPVCLSGKSHGQRSLVGYRPWGCKESDTTEQLNDDGNDVCVCCVYIYTHTYNNIKNIEERNKACDDFKYCFLSMAHYWV